MFILQHEREYMEILEAARGSEKEKKLASQFIGKFFKHFPNLSEIAIDRQLDLCEDDDVLVSFIFNFSIFLLHANIILFLDL